MLIKFQITNWKKYNPRADRNNYSWFRFENTFFTDPLNFGLSPECQLFCVFLFCEASKNGKGEGELNINLASVLLKTTPQKVKKFVQDIESTGIATFDNQAQPDDTNGSPTNERTNVTNEQTNTRTPASPRVIFDFEALYEKFPRKVGKTRGMKLCKSRIKTQKQYDSLSTAIDNFSKIKKGIEEQYIKQFDTFMNCWEDYVKPDVSELPKRKINGEAIRAAISSGAQKVSDVKVEGFGELEKEWVINHGGLLNLSRETSFNLNRAIHKTNS